MGLSRFFPALVENTKLINIESFNWSDQCEQSFSKLTNFLNMLPVLTKPKKEIEIIVYLAEFSEQKPVYFVSKAL